MTMQESLSPSQCNIVSDFFKTLIQTANKANNRINVGEFMKVYREQYVSNRQATEDMQKAFTVRKVEHQMYLQSIESVLRANAHKPVKEVAKLVGKHPATVAGWYRQRGIDRVSWKGRKWQEVAR